MMRSLFLSAIMLLGACAPSHPVLKTSTADPNCIQKFAPDFQSELYKTSVDVVGKHLSGLLLIKKMDDQSLRIVFTNEAGFKFFDIGFESSGEYKIYQALKKIKRKSVMTTFRKDFDLMLMNKFKVRKPLAHEEDHELKFSVVTGEEVDHAVTDPDCNQLLRLEKWGKKKMTEVRLFGDRPVPDSIRIQHFNFDMTIQMKRIQR